MSISTELSLIMLESLEEANNNILDFFDTFEGSREIHILLSVIREQITSVITHIKTVIWNQLQTHQLLLAQHGFCYVYFRVDLCERQAVNSVYVVYS